MFQVQGNTGVCQKGSMITVKEMPFTFDGGKCKLTSKCVRKVSTTIALKKVLATYSPQTGLHPADSARTSVFLCP